MNRQSEFIASLFPFAVIAAVMSLAAYWTPYALDNHIFEAALLRRCPDGFTIAGFLDYADAIREVDNWRLPNVLAPVVSLYLPKWLFAVVTGLATAFIAYAVATLGNGMADGSRTPRPRFARVYIIYVFAAMLAFIPWSNNLLTGDYAMNYIWGCALSMALNLAARSAVGRKGAMILPALLGVVLGLWHEGIAVATAAGIAAMAFAVRFDRRYMPYYVAGAVTAVTAIIWMSLSYLTERASGELASAALLDDTLRFVRYNILSIALLGYVAWQLAWPRRRGKLREFLKARPLAVLFSGISFAALVIAAVTAFSGRAACCGEVTAIAAFAIFAEPFVVRHNRDWISVGVGIVSLSLCFAEILFCKAFDESYRAFEESIADSPDGTVYGPIFLPQDFPSWLPQFVPRSLFVEPFTYRVLSERYAPRRVAIVPVEFGFINFGGEVLQPVETQHGNFYMAPREDVTGPVVLDNIEGLDGRFFAIPFATRTGEMICLYPLR